MSIVLRYRKIKNRGYALCFAIILNWLNFYDILKLYFKDGFFRRFEVTWHYLNSNTIYFRIEIKGNKMKEIKKINKTELHFVTPIPNYIDWWNKVLDGFPEYGKPGLQYGKTTEGTKIISESIIYRNDFGELLGLFEHFLVNTTDEKKGNINVMVSPHHFKQGIGLSLLRKANEKMNLCLEQQHYTPLGYKLLRSFLRENGIEFKEHMHIENYLNAFLNNKFNIKSKMK